MQKADRLLTGSSFSRILLTVIAWCLTTSVGARAQTAGNKAIYNANSACCTSSAAFIDASVLSGSTICQKIYNALQALPAAGGVVDARGIPTPALCTGTETPWLQAGNNLLTPSTILLPAGAIVISSPWIVPDATRIIGEGIGGEGSNGNTSGTTIQVPSSFSGAMIKMGDSVHCPAANHICHGISIEDLTLDGEAQNVNGILNTSAQELSYVDHVKFFQVLGTGLTVSTNAQNSGPYSNITFDTGGVAPLSSTSCVQITGGLTGTRGIHGLTCISSSNDSTAAVFLDASNNSVEDVRIMGFYDGILIGSQAAAHGNVLFNIFGDTVYNGGTPIHVVHISPNFPVTDLSIMSVANSHGGPLGEYTIEDDASSKTLSDPFVAMYVLGQSSNGNYSRYTTSPNAASWAVGNGTPNGGCITTASLGSLYSNTGTSGGVLWVCEKNPTNPAWVKIQ